MKSLNFVLLLFIFFLYSCVLEQAKISITTTSQLNVTLTSIQKTSDKLILIGNNLVVVNSIKIKNGNETITLNIESKSQGQLIANSMSNVSLKAGIPLTITLSNTFNSSDFDFEFTLCDSTFGAGSFDCDLPVANHNILSYNSNTHKWEPRHPSWKPTINISANHTMAPTDSVLIANATTAAFTITLPSAAYLTGKQFTIKKSDSTANKITISPFTAETIDGKSSFVLTLPQQLIMLTSNGASWEILQSSKRLTTCPPTMTLKEMGRKSYCIEKVSRTGTADFPTAANICLADGYDLCNYQEWSLACQDGAPFVNDALNWLSDPFVIQAGGSGRFIVMGQGGNCTDNSSSFGYQTSSYGFRCCLR